MMVRAVKNQALPPDEKLSQALVPESKQPYTVPDNWVWTRLEIINQYLGTSVDPMKSPDETFELYSVPSCDNDYPEVVIGSEIGSTKQVVEKNDVLLCKINPRINRVWVVSKHTENAVIASSEWIIIRNRQINAKYLMWCLKSKYFRELMLSNVSGVGGSLMRAQPRFVKDYPIPLPPLAEQQRIVEYIEGLFAKLDQIKELSKNALDSFETRKACILHKAFTGKLTTKWREDHNVGMESWELHDSVDIFEYVTSGSRGWAQYYSDTGSVFLRMGNLKHGTINLDLTEIQYVTLPTKVEGQRSKVCKGDILISITADVGMVGLVKDDNLDAYVNQHVALARPIENVNPEYIAWYLVSDLGLKQLQNKQRGATKLGLGLSDIKSLELHLPSFPEQQEIVRILDSLFEKDQKAKDLCDVIGKIDLMKKAILARAYRGELGTNDPSEKSAEELLKKVVMETITEGIKQKVVNSKAIEEVRQVYKNVLEALQLNRKMIPEDLKKLLDLDADSFYEQVKLFVELGKITEVREGKEVYLEA